MEQTLQALSGILLKAVPTAVLLIVLHFYLKAMLFRPLQKMLKEREALTAGARKAAADSLAAAERKAEDYEAKFRDARSEVYREQEETRRVWIEDQAKQIAAGQARTAESLAAARKHLAEETAAAKASLVDTSAALADKIATKVLARRLS
jgi:F-type H+-transporting ATPase subunit b